MAKNPKDMNPADFVTYLAKHGITEVKQRGNEISFACPLHGCDDDHRSNEEYHFSFNCEQCVWHCFKCGEEGNYITLLKHFGDYGEYCAQQKQTRVVNKDAKAKPTTFEAMVLKAHEKTRDLARGYFNGRGINDDSINRFKLGIWNHDGYKGFMIPVFDRDGKVAYLKLRRMPEAESAETVAKAMGKEQHVNKYTVYPTGSKLLLVGEDELIKSTASDVLICEGELDRIISIQEGVKMPVVSSGGGAMTFKDDWFSLLENR